MVKQAKTSRKQTLIAIKPEYERELPFTKKIPSFLATLTLLSCLEKDEALNILQFLCQRSRAYCIKQEKILDLWLLYVSFTKNLHSRRASTTVLSMYGNPNEVI